MNEIKRRRYLWGLKAERMAALWLKLKGYQILETRYKSPAGEIDLIAKKGRMLVAVEVKARATWDQGAESITEHQKRRIVRGFESYLSRSYQGANYDVRFDVILISPWSWPHHIQNAWMAR